MKRTVLGLIGFTDVLMTNALLMKTYPAFQKSQKYHTDLEALEMIRLLLVSFIFQGDIVQRILSTSSGSVGLLDEDMNSYVET